MTIFDFWTFWPSAPISLSPNDDHGEKIDDVDHDEKVKNDQTEVSAI